MKLNAIKLDTAVITDLYKKNLVASNDPGLPLKHAATTAVTGLVKETASQLPFLGENKKNILVLVNYREVSYLPDDDLLFFTSMLSACRLSLADVAIMNLEKIPDPSYKSISTVVSNSSVLLFGVAPSALQLPLDFPHFQVQSFNNSTFLYTPALGDIKNDKALKSKLWVCLQKIFNL